MRGVRLLGRSDPVVSWDGERAYCDADLATGRRPPASLDGLAAGFQRLDDGSVRVFRDRLGLGKLFWARDDEGGLRFAARPATLIRAGHALSDIRSLPRGRMIELDPAGRLVVDTAFAPARPASGWQAWSPEEIGARIGETLDAYLAAIAAAHPGRRAFLCLSGGLDSSTIAVLARRHFPAITGVSFDLAVSGRGESEDRLAAQRLAGDLGIPLLEASVSVEQLLSWLDLVLAEGIDWRDFNVHCGLVNAALADAVARECRSEDPPLMITGDLTNEFLIDYQAESYGGTSYYALPRLDPVRLRSILIDGLDTCHREVGVFAAFGLVAVQPYAACVEAYRALPADFLRAPDRKDRLVRAIVGAELPDYIYQRPKVRAQLGTEHGGGTLAACVDNGIDGVHLRRRFAMLHGLEEPEALDRFIRAGRYRAAVPTLQESVHGYA